MECKKSRLIMMDYIFDELSASGRQLLENHLQACSSCRTELQELKQTAAVMKKWPDLLSEHVSLQRPFGSTGATPAGRKLTKKIFYSVLAAAASILIVLSLLNFKLSYTGDAMQVSLSLWNKEPATRQRGAAFLNEEQLAYIVDLIEVSRQQQKKETLAMLSEFYKASEMKRQADLKLISQGIKYLETSTQERLDDTNEVLGDLIRLASNSKPINLEPNR